MRTQTRRKFIAVAGGIGLGATAGCLGSNTGAGSGGGDPDEYSLDAVAGATGFGFAFTHHYAGLLDELPAFSDGRHSVDMRQIDSASLHVQALISKSVDYYRGSIGHPLNAHIVGTPIRFIGAGSVGNQWVVVLHDDIDSLDPFVNGEAQFGFSSPGGSTHQNIIGVFEAEGYDSSKIGYVSVGKSSDRARAAAAGQVMGTIIREGQFQEIKDEAPVWKYREMREIYPKFPNAIAVRASWLDDEAQEDHAAHAVKGLVSAGHKAMTDFDWFFENYQKYIGTALDRDEVRSTWEFNVEVIEDFPYRKNDFAVADYQRLLENILVPAGIIEDPDAVDIEEIVVKDYWDQAVEELGIE